MHALFGALSYPYHPIRNDAITAVGAPSTIGFLMRAIYWLYQVVKVYFLSKRIAADNDGDIQEAQNEEGDDDVPMASNEDGGLSDEGDEFAKIETKFLEEHPEEKVFKELLNEALQYASYSEPP